MTGMIIFLFLCVFGSVLVSLAIGFSVVEGRRKKQVTSMFQTVAGATEGVRPTVLIQRPDEYDAVTRVLERLNLSSRIQQLLSQAGLDSSVSQLVLIAVAMGVVGMFIGAKLNVFFYSPLSLLVTGFVFGALPFLFVAYKRSVRFAEIEKQLPEALDFLARSMRAGHAFSISLEMMGQESPDPLGREFRLLFNEQNLGANMEASLGNLARRVPLIDMRFFVSAVLLQRQTGGNLSEILTRLSYVIRERFQLKGQVKAASAHGRMTAIILSLLPIALTLGLLIVAPEYLRGMARDPDGQKLIIGAIFGQFLGYYFIRRIIDIKV